MKRTANYLHLNAQSEVMADNLAYAHVALFT